jgi:tetratricopeptide (TPR) repeat protein
MAVRHYDEILQKAIELEDTELQGKVYSNLGTAHQELENVDDAQEYYTKSLNIALQVTGRVRSQGGCWVAGCRVGGGRGGEGRGSGAGYMPRDAASPGSPCAVGRWMTSSWRAVPTATSLTCTP